MKKWLIRFKKKGKIATSTVIASSMPNAASKMAGICTSIISITPIE